MPTIPLFTVGKDTSNIDKIFVTATDVPKKNIKMGDTDIEWVENFKYLGVTLDQRLSFKTHSEKVAKRAMITWANVRKMIGSNWGLNPEIARWSYLALVRPLLSYGSIVWANRTDWGNRITAGYIKR